MEDGFSGEPCEREPSTGDGDEDADRDREEHDHDRADERRFASDDELWEGESEEDAGVVDW